MRQQGMQWECGRAGDCVQRSTSTLGGSSYQKRKPGQHPKNTDPRRGHPGLPEIVPTLWSLVVYVFNPRTQKAEAGGYLTNVSSMVPGPQVFLKDISAANDGTLERNPRCFPHQPLAPWLLVLTPKTPLILKDKEDHMGKTFLDIDYLTPPSNCNYP
ncbi:hypothetical protein STEG23_023666, partial [Scotinomys teguina]